MAHRMTRRRFLEGAAAGGAALVVLGNARSARTAEANTKLGVALIGVGGRGEWFVDTMPKMENVVAFCDVNQQKIDKAFQRWADDRARISPEKVKTYHDFRKMFDEMGRGIDAAVVATPDHIHAVASAAAMHAGKHVYTEKPLTRAVGESRALRDLARRQKVATSMGNQGTASGAYRRALELIRGGAIGRVTEVHSWTDGGGADFKEPPRNPPSGPPPVPDYLKWDLWLGPAADRPYHPGWHGQWHSWRDFGTANLGNWASHIQNLAFRALDVHTLWLAEPAPEPHPVIKIEAKTSGINRLAFPRSEVVRWEIPARGDLPPTVFTWHAGGQGSRAQIEALLGRDLDWGDKGEKKWADWAGHLLIGTKGKLLANAHNTTFALLPEADFKDVKRDAPEKEEPSRGHEMDWLLACRGARPAWACYDFAGALTEFNMLGNVATQFEGPLEFDPVTCRITNNAEADKCIRPEYRRGWSL